MELRLSRVAVGVVSGGGVRVGGYFSRGAHGNRTLEIFSVPITTSAIPTSLELPVLDVGRRAGNCPGDPSVLFPALQWSKVLLPFPLPFPSLQNNFHLTPAYPTILFSLFSR